MHITQATTTTTMAKGDSNPPIVVWVTGAPGTGKTTFVKEHILGSAGAIDLERWPLNKMGGNPQLVWHTSADGRVAVAGAYTFPDDERFPKRRRGTSPPNGGTDTLQPQAVALLAALLRGEVHAAGGRAPEVVVVEGCAKAKVGGPLVQRAMRDARRLYVFEVHESAHVAVSRLASRDRTHDGKGVSGESAASVHAAYAAQVEAMLRLMLSEEVTAWSGWRRAPCMKLGFSAAECAAYLREDAEMRELRAALDF